MAPVLYKRQRETLDFLYQYINKFGHAPTLSEIAKALQINTVSTVHEQLQNLERKGLIKRIHGDQRGYEFLADGLEMYAKKTDNTLELPILGYIAAGKPLEPYTDPNATLTVPMSLVGDKRTFVLHVKGESMIDEGILDGDFVIVEEQKVAKDGQIVVALLEGGLATLKRFFQEATRVRLEPANPKMTPIYATNVQIQGKVIGLFRKY